MIELRGIKKEYNKSSPVLYDTNLTINDGGFGSLDVGNIAASWGIGLGVGAVAGGLSYCGTQVGAYFGEMIGITLSGKTFLGVAISKIISSGFLADFGAWAGGALGGFVVGSFINNSATDSGVQNQNVPLWVGTIIKILFGKK